MKKKNPKWKPQNRINTNLPDYVREKNMVDESIQKMEHRLVKTTGESYKIIRDETLASMSEILLDFAEPIVNAVDMDDRDAYENAIKMSIVFWNASTMIEMSRTSRKGIIRKLLDALMVHKLLKPFTRNAESNEISLFMLGRKQQLYPNVNRLIMDYELIDTVDGYHITVATTVQQGSLSVPLD